MTVKLPNLKKVKVVSPINPYEINNLLVKENFELTEETPDFIICYGGDGTLLFAERRFPEVPKLSIKRSRNCRKCDYKLSSLRRILQDIRNGNYQIEMKIKVETKLKKTRLVGLNEIQIHTKLPIHAVRFSVSINKKKITNLIGDGVIISTPFGSTGYFKSTGGTPFKKGIGISFNNLHNKRKKSFTVSDNSKVIIEIIRGPALVCADNYQRIIDVKSQDMISITKSTSIAKFISCPKWNVMKRK